MNWKALVQAWIIQFALMIFFNLFLLWKFNIVLPQLIRFAIGLVVISILFILLDRKPDPPTSTQG
jgi:hypothetical protein